MPQLYQFRGKLASVQSKQTCYPHVSKWQGGIPTQRIKPPLCQPSRVKNEKKSPIRGHVGITHMFFLWQEVLSNKHVGITHTLWQEVLWPEVLTKPVFMIHSRFPADFLWFTVDSRQIFYYSQPIFVIHSVLFVIHSEFLWFTTDFWIFMIHIGVLWFTPDFYD